MAEEAKNSNKSNAEQIMAPELMTESLFMALKKTGADVNFDKDTILQLMLLTSKNMATNLELIAALAFLANDDMDRTNFHYTNAKEKTKEAFKEYQVLLRALFDKTDEQQTDG